MLGFRVLICPSPVVLGEKLELPAPARLLLTQQLALLKELAVRIREDEETLEELLQESPALKLERRPLPRRAALRLGRRFWFDGKKRDPL